MPYITATKYKVLELNLEMKNIKLSFEHIRKNHNTILIYTSQWKVFLYNSYYIEMREYLNNSKKEVASSKKKG